MKIILLLLVAVLPLSDWQTDFEKARQQAASEKRLILLNFSGSDWCAPCIRLKKEVFEQASFQTYAAENLVLVQADFPRLKKNRLTETQQSHNEKLAEQYNPSGKFPFTLLLDAEGNIINTWDGFDGAPVEHFIDKINAYVTRK